MTTEKRTPRELTVSAARAKIRKLDSEYQADAEAVAKAAVDKLRERYAAKRAAILNRVHPAARSAVENVTEDEQEEAPASIPPRIAEPLSDERIAIGRGRR